MELWPLLMIAAVAAALLAAMRIKQRQGRAGVDDQPWPYQPRRIMTDREQALYHRLREALPDCLVFTQVPLSQVLAVKYRTKNAQVWLKKLSQKSVDFVVCQADSSVLAVIDFDDKSNSSGKHVVRDADTKKALRDARIKLIRARAVPSVATVCKVFGRQSPPTSHEPVLVDEVVVELEDEEQVSKGRYESPSGFPQTQIETPFA